jgi:hypothetical protein
MELTASKQGDEYFAHVHDLIFTDARTAIIILERPESQAWAKDARFAVMKHEAKAQAMD